MFKTEYEFTLPRGFVDKDGNLHKKGVMRLATAKDEIAPLQDHRVRSNQAYMIIILLSRVITRLGELNSVDSRTVEQFFSIDLDYLQRFYQKINESENTDLSLKCPHCSEEMSIPFDEVLPSGE
ncbi:MAG TPA: phage tail assembly protein [Arcobacter sp.]|nr:phage tail assembly protein [Arcobacter sp.]